MSNDMFSIIVLTHNKSEVTKRCLDDLLRSTATDWELVVVENGSTDDTMELLDAAAAIYGKAGRSLRVIHNEHNLGCSTGRNQGIQIARGERIIFLDNDIRLGDADWIERLSAALDADERHAIVGPKLVFAWDGKMVQFAGGAISPTGRVQFVGRGESADELTYCVRREVQFIISACMMFRRSLIDEIGMLDEAFNPVQFEDIDFCYRARSHGYKVIYEGGVTMLHDESATTAETPGLNNPYVVTKHAMLFKKRWHHMFEKEGGPPDDQIAWKRIGRFAENPTEFRSRANGKH